MRGKELAKLFFAVTTAVSAGSVAVTHRYTESHKMGAMSSQDISNKLGDSASFLTTNQQVFLSEYARPYLTPDAVDILAQAIKDYTAAHNLDPSTQLSVIGVPLYDKDIQLNGFLLLAVGHGPIIYTQEKSAGVPIAVSPLPSQLLTVSSGDEINTFSQYPNEKPKQYLDTLNNQEVVSNVSGYAVTDDSSNSATSPFNLQIVSLDKSSVKFLMDQQTFEQLLIQYYVQHGLSPFLPQVLVHIALNTEEQTSPVVDEKNLVDFVTVDLNSDFPSPTEIDMNTISPELAEKFGAVFHQKWPVTTDHNDAINLITEVNGEKIDIPVFQKGKPNQKPRTSLGIYVNQDEEKNVPPTNESLPPIEDAEIAVAMAAFATFVFSFIQELLTRDQSQQTEPKKSRGEREKMKKAAIIENYERPEPISEPDKPVTTTPEVDVKKPFLVTIGQDTLPNNLTKAEFEALLIPAIQKMIKETKTKKKIDPQMVDTLNQRVRSSEKEIQSLFSHLRNAKVQGNLDKVAGYLKSFSRIDQESLQTHDEITFHYKIVNGTPPQPIGYLSGDMSREKESIIVRFSETLDEE